MREPQPLGAGSRPGRWRPVTGVVLCLAAVVLGGRVVCWLGDTGQVGLT